MSVGYVYKLEHPDCGRHLVRLEIHKMSKINELAKLLTEVLSEGKDIDSSEFPFINITGDINGKGILWTGQGYNKQFYIFF